ncbi:MAG: lipoprotein-releasing ABC transporter ATP-binding protein LolD [Porticoccaceae bacterium]|nr:lipoprotein-releasing ABC transporter ATP-binding protein LolD [Porticoccaceae bacterium]
MTESTVLQCVDLTKTYRQGPETIDVLNGLNLAVAKGESIAIIGASGSGKTTLLNLLGGLDDPTEGSVSIAGREVGPCSENERARWRNRHLGFVYQFHHLLPEFSALENVLMPLLIAKTPVAEARARATDVLGQVGLAQRLSHKPAELSGGERQRVAIARALVANPDCVLMDEPTGNLDSDTAHTILELLLHLNRERETSFVIVTHDRHVAAQMSRTLKLDRGQLLEVAGA